MNDFEGQSYRDDRMFILYIAKCTVRDRGDGYLDYTIYHDTAPEECDWALVMYRNTTEYPVHMIEHFATLDEAKEWQERVEPIVPRVSLGGATPREAPTYASFTKWKSDNHCAEYDYRALYSPDGSNPRELITIRKK